MSVHRILTDRGWKSGTGDVYYQCITKCGFVVPGDQLSRSDSEVTCAHCLCAPKDQAFFRMQVFCNGVPWRKLKEVPRDRDEALPDPA